MGFRPKWDPAPPQRLRAILRELNPKQLGQLATLEPCEKCRRPVLRGFDGPIPYRADLVLLDSAGELQAKLERRLTYALYWPWPLELKVRGLYDLRSYPPERCAQPVLPEHACGEVDMLGPAIPWEMIYPKMNDEERTNEPPF